VSTTPVLAASYDYRLVVLSFIISLFTSYTALSLAARVTANHGFMRVAWLMGGAFAMGIGIWCMHFIGMLAFRLPIPVYYHVPTVITSLAAAIAASAIALYVVSRRRLGLANLVVGSLLMGSGIAAMHYIGMAAMRLAAMHYYKTELLIISIVLAVIISSAGLEIIYHSGGEDRPWQRTLGAAFALGMAIPIMHYTGMAAVHFVASPVPPVLTHAVDISTLAYAGILSATLVVLGFALLIAVADRRWTAQQLLLESERKMLRALIDNIPDLMYVKDNQSCFVLANPQIARAIGANGPEDLIGKTEFDFLPAERASAWYESEQQIIATGEPAFNHEAVMLDKDGKEIPFLVSTVPIWDSEGQVVGIAGVRRNISERKKSEEALAAAERKYRAMFDQALFGIFQLDSDGCLLNSNTAMAQLLLYETPKGMLECFRDPLWIAAVSPQRASELLMAIDGFGYVRGFEFELYRKDRSRIWISATIRSLGKGDAGFEGMFEDITERRSLREQLLQAQKLESVGQLAAGIAHEINTPTQYIGDNVRFLKKSFIKLESVLGSYGRLYEAIRGNAVSPGLIQETESALKKTNLKLLLEEIPKAIDDGLEGIQRVSSLVTAMKEFSHPGTKEKTPLDLNHAIQSTITIARAEWKYVADMETNFEPSLPHVCCLPGEFNQVILNLIVNAAHAIGDRNREGNGTKGTIRVQTTYSPTGVEIRIGDTGTGIPPEARAKIFDPFFTTKEIGKGTGQGLAIARSVIVDKHGGSIDFETVMGEGTTFVIRLPIGPQPALGSRASL
jgi:PAS domain S-box-containing protein